MSGKIYKFCKRLLDILISIIIIIIFLPLLVIIYLLLLIYYGHSPIFKQIRVGKNGVPFNILKFQTMVDDADKVLDSFPNKLKKLYYKNYKLDTDLRITRLGKVLRRFSLDELPQLFNVLKGEMSLIGPRPVVLDELTKYGKNSFKLVEVKPGITGLWQINGNNCQTYSERIDLDMFYIDNLSLKLDLKIFFRTIIFVIKRGEN